MFLLPRATTSCSLIINAYHLAFNQPVVAAATVATAASALSHNSHHSSTQRNKQQAAMTVASSDCIEAAAGACNPTAATAAGKADGVDGVSSRSAPPYNDAAALDAHVERAWAHYRRLGSPKWMVAPMVDQSELPFRMLCRAHGAQAAYTPMFHARLFVEHEYYRPEFFTTCPEDRPLFVQFSANEPDAFLAAGAAVQDDADYIDLNLGCPQRIAKRGFYGAFLMEHQDLVQQLVSSAAAQLRTPVSVKIRLFSDLEETIAYAQMLERAGASLIAIHGRTREMKDHAAHRADWVAIAAVRKALRVPVVANGDVRCLADAEALMAATGADGVMSAEPLLNNPMLFDPSQPPEATDLTGLQSLDICEEYLRWCVKYPSHLRMVRGHVHKLITDWLGEFDDIRRRMHRLDHSQGLQGDIQQLLDLVAELRVLAAATGRDYAIPKLPERKIKAQEREAAKAAAIAEQEREAAALAEVEAAKAAAAAGGCGGGCGGGGRQPQQQQQVSAVSAASEAAAAAVVVDCRQQGVARQQQPRPHEQQQPQTGGKQQQQPVVDSLAC